MTPSSAHALQHLNRIKPLDGWDVQQKPGAIGLVRLTRRSAPVTDNYFYDIHLCGGQVVGILTNKSSIVQGQVLVDQEGKLFGQRASLVQVSNYDVTSSSNVPATRTASASMNSNSLSDAQNNAIIFYGGALLAAAISMRIVHSTIALIFFVLPALFLYSAYSCPAPKSFDAKRELKRVLRGHHLPEDHPNKPKGFLGETLARIQASVTTEIATIPGYEVTMIPVAGALLIASARVPSVATDFYWIGIWNHWWFAYSTQPTGA